MVNEKTDEYYVDKIVEDIKFVLSHMESYSLEMFENDELLIDSVMFRIVKISQNVDNLTEEFKSKIKNIEWYNIKGMRNRIVHDYGSVDVKIVYNTALNDLPVLLRSLKDN